MLSVNLDPESEKYLVEILSKEETTSSALIKQLLYKHLQALKHFQNPYSPQTVLEKMGGYPEHLLSGSGDLSDRDVRRQLITEQLRSRHQQSQQIEP